MNIDIIKEQAILTYSTADSNTKASLEKIFGESFFLPITERIKTWEDAAAAFGVHPVNSLPFINPKNSFQEATNAFFQLDIIAQVLSEGKILDWTNRDQYKWYPCFNNYYGAGFRFYDSRCAWACARADGGARLCLPTEALANYFGTQFLPTWNKFLNPNK